MAKTRNLVQCEEDSPYRCQSNGTGGEGQCRYYNVEGLVREKYWEDVNLEDVKGLQGCPKHGGTVGLRKVKKDKLHDYRLSIWQDRIDEFSESERMKTLKGEIGILRLTLETIINRCETAHDLIMFSSRIADICIKIEKLVLTCEKLDNRMGLVLDEVAALTFARQVVDVLTSEIDDPHLIDKISGKLIGVMGNLRDNQSPIETLNG